MALDTGTTYIQWSEFLVGQNHPSQIDVLNRPLQSIVANVQTALNLKEDIANKGIANGYAGLDAGGKVPALQLPSYVDDVLEFATLTALPAIGETGKIYITLDTNGEYRWSGSVYIHIGSIINGTTQRQSFTATAGQTIFVITGGYNYTFADVYLNGLKLLNGTDVDVTSGINVVLTTGANVGDIVDVVAYGNFLVANTYTQAQADLMTVFPVNTITDLLSIDFTRHLTVNVKGYTSINDGGGDVFNWDSTVDKATANPGITIDPSVSLALQGTGIGLGCWVRQYIGDIDSAWFGASISRTDNQIPIQNALDTAVNNLTVTFSENYACSAGIVVRGSSKLLKGINMPSLTFTGLDLTCVSVEPTTLATVDTFSGIEGFSIQAQNCTGNANRGVVISGNTFFAKAHDIDINKVGLGATGGIGFSILGGYDVSLPGNGHSTPFFCDIDRIRVSDCYNGYDFGFGINGGPSALTTMKIGNVYCATPQGYGYTFQNVSYSTISAINCESSVGYGVVLDNTSNNNFAGGIVEGSTLANWHFLNRTVTPDTVFCNVYHDTSTITTYPEFPDTYITNGSIIQKKVKAPLVAVNNTEILDISSFGILSILTRYGAWSKTLLSYATYPTGQFTEILEKGITKDVWSVTAGTAGKINIYWNAVTSTWQIQNLTGLAQTISIQLFSEG